MEGDEGLTPPSGNKQKTFSDWADELCPYYMAIGVSYDDYWHGDYSALPFYVKAQEIKAEQENRDMWTLGGYICDAMHVAIGNAFRKKGESPVPYLKEPYPLTKEESTRRAERDRLNAIAVARDQFEAWAETKFMNKGG